MDEARKAKKLLRILLRTARSGTDADANPGKEPAAMAFAGDPTKQPPECAPRFTPSAHDSRFGTWSRCPNLKEVGGGTDGERYGCDVCGKSYFLDYDDMR